MAILVNKLDGSWLKDDDWLKDDFAAVAGPVVTHSPMIIALNAATAGSPGARRRSP